MQRFLVRFITFLLCLIFTQLVPAQTNEEILEEFLKQRDAMMEEISKMFEDEPFLNDNFFRGNRDSNFSRSRNKPVKIEEVFEKDGSSSILITPKSDDVNLDIQTDKNMKTNLPISLFVPEKY